jgi:hypothetical protein
MDWSSRLFRLGALAVIFRDQVNDGCIARLTQRHRDDAKGEQHQQQPEIDAQRQGEPRDASLERLAIVRGR